MYSDDDLLPLSALQHLTFCRRQCALIHIEQQWAENFFTAQGRVLHEKAHEEGREDRGNVRIERGALLKSRALGLIGRSDVIEFHPADQGQWIPFPVEYKRGRAKPEDCDRVQLCAQALCLEETLSLRVPVGAIFYGKTRRREEVVFTDDLRGKTAQTARGLHDFMAAGKTPEAVYSEKCDACSLLEVCVPKVCDGQSVGPYLKRILGEDEKPS